MTIPNSVKYIQSYAFSGCSNLTSVTIPESVTSLGEGTFYNCSCLTSVTIPNSVKRIEFYAFQGCSALASVTIPNSVTSIDDKAFYGCSSLATLICYADEVPTLGSDVFEKGDVAFCTLKVPAASVELYKAADQYKTADQRYNYQWNYFGLITAIDGSEPEAKKCAKPTISYADNKLTYATETEGAQVVSTVAVADAKTSYDKEIPLTATYNITAYATKADYDNSDIASATLVWATGTLSTDINEAKVMTVDALPLLISQEEGMVTVSGLNDGDTIAAYGADGTQVVKTKAVGNAALMNLSELQSKVAVLSVNGKSAKVMIK